MLAILRRELNPVCVPLGDPLTIRVRRFFVKKRFLQRRSLIASTRSDLIPTMDGNHSKAAHYGAKAAVLPLETTSSSRPYICNPHCHF